MSFGISASSHSFSSGIRTVRNPAPIKAASSFSLSPPIGQDFAAQGDLTGHGDIGSHRSPVRADTIAVSMPTPALGPSFGVAPSGTCTWCTSCFW